MSFFNLLKNKSDSELQSELKALIQHCIAQPSAIYSQGNRYEELLKELYMRNIEPEMTLVRESNKKLPCGCPRNDKYSQCVVQSHMSVK